MKQDSMNTCILELFHRYIVMNHLMKERVLIVTFGNIIVDTQTDAVIIGNTSYMI